MRVECAVGATRAFSADVARGRKRATLRSPLHSSVALGPWAMQSAWKPPLAGGGRVYVCTCMCAMA